MCGVYGGGAGGRGGAGKRSRAAGGCEGDVTGAGRVVADGRWVGRDEGRGAVSTRSYSAAADSLDTVTARPAWAVPWAPGTSRAKVRASTLVQVQDQAHVRVGVVLTGVVSPVWGRAASPGP